MRVAVTGVTGFIGGAIARRLHAADHEVVGLGRRPSPPAGPVRYLRWDLASGEPAPPILASCDAIVHAAARVSPWGPDAPFRETAVRGTARLLDGIGPDARVIVIGSASVYDPNRAGDPAREPEAPVDERRYRNAYARSKAAQERLVVERRPDALVLRPRAVWGPGDETLLPRILARVRAGRLLLPGGGARPASMTFVDSLVDAVEAGLASSMRGPVNVADATPIPPARLLRVLFAGLGRDVRIVGIPVAMAEAAAAALETAWTAAGRRDEPPFTRYAVDAIGRPLVLDLARLHDGLGVAPDADVDFGVARVVAVMREAGHGDGEDDRSSPP
jgi:nucleoside-diphosphate-sugar epimerase